MIAEAGTRGLEVKARKERTSLAPRLHRTNSATRMWHSLGRGGSQRPRENAGVRWRATHGRVTLATARALRMQHGSLSEAEKVKRGNYEEAQLKAG
eukprot:4116306-Pyramimonas_sp.AAC.1